MPVGVLGVIEEVLTDDLDVWVGKKAVYAVYNFRLLPCLPIAFLILDTHEGNGDCIVGVPRDAGAGDVASAGFEVEGEFEGALVSKVDQVIKGSKRVSI
jgi:hypothetical protein